MKARLPRYGRSEDSLKIMPAVTVVVADNDAEAADLARHIREQQVSGPTAIVLAELLWGRDLSAYDPDGPLPAEDPVVDGGVTKGRVGYNDPGPVVAEWRAQAEAHGWSLRETVINQQNRQTFIGSASTVAAAMNWHIQEDAADGFVLVPHLTPGGLDDFVAKVVPLLRERGVLRTEYSGTTLRHHLGLS